MQKKSKKNVCARCGMPKDTFTRHCASCLDYFRLDRYRARGREDIAKAILESSCPST